MKSKILSLALLTLLPFYIYSQKEIPVHVNKTSGEIDNIVSESPKVKLIKGDFRFVEGPVWNKDGYLLFSDIPANRIYKYTPSKGVDVFLEPSGHSNGLTYDKSGNLIICEHDGRITKMEKNGKKATLVDKFEGKRLNSPNDAVIKSDGSLYFTDPPYGLSRQDESEEKELDFNGIYRLKNGKLTLLDKTLARPNGIALSPDENHLYVANSAENDKFWMVYEVLTSGELRNGKKFYTIQSKGGGPDGMKVDIKGNIYGTAPDGIMIFSPNGEHLGTIHTPETPANIGWGGKDNKTLFITARTSLYSIDLKIPGYLPY